MLWLSILAAALTWALVGGYIFLMNARGQLDLPNERSMHKQPVPAGAGAIAVAIAVLGWLAFAAQITQPALVLAVGALGLALLGWLDDMLGLPVWLRFGAQMAAILACIFQLPVEARALPFLPLLMERAIEALAWGWFVNLFNFMDGIDGLAGSEAASVSLGYVAVAGLAAYEAPLAVLLVATMLGYLAWNWAPARVMMGDAGSIPLGFLLGWMMLDLGVRGHLVAALILPLVFCVDATYTLIARMLRGKLPYQAHREHFYQRAALGCGSHATVVSGVILANLGLTLAALISLRHPTAAAVAAGIVVATLFMRLRWLARPNASLV